MVKEQKFSINAQGLLGSKRAKNDGCTFFGSVGANSGWFGLNKEKELMNDVVIGDNIQGTDIGRRHFVVKYKMDTKGYYLKDLGDGSGTFVRVDRPLVTLFLRIIRYQILSNGFLISFGDSHMIVQI